MKGIVQRLHVLRQWTRGHRNAVTVPELVRFATRPPSSLIAHRMSTNGTGDAIHVQGALHPLYWPSGVDRRWLVQTVAELCNPNDWHYYEIPETRVQPGDVVADCGAAEGLFTLLVQERASHIHAFEPGPIWQDALRRTMAPFSNVTIIPAALGASLGRTSFQCPEHPTGKLDAPLETIDHYFNGRPLNYIKADLETAELKMLAGAWLTIQQYRPRIAITTYHHPDHARIITEFLLSIHSDYRIRVKGIEATWGAPVMLHAW